MARRSSSGTCRPSPAVPSCSTFHGNGDFLAGCRRPLSKHHRRRHRPRRAVLSRLCRLERAARASRGCCRMPRRPMPSRRRAIDAGPHRASGASRSAPASRWRWPPSSRIGRLILEAPYTSIADVAASAFPFVPVRLLMRDQFRSDRAHRAGHGAAADHAWRARSDDPVAFGERLFALAHEPKQFVRLARGGHDDLDNFGAHRNGATFHQPCQGVMAAVNGRQHPVRAGAHGGVRRVPVHGIRAVSPPE